jgi:hypothetical protein
MREHALAGGKCMIRSVPGTGTTRTSGLPLRRRLRRPSAGRDRTVSIERFRRALTHSSLPVDDHELIRRGLGPSEGESTEVVDEAASARCRCASIVFLTTRCLTSAVDVTVEVCRELRARCPRHG